MKKLYILSLALAASFSFAQQAPPFREGFEYVGGSALQTQPTWIALNTGDDLLINDLSLTYPGIPATVGNKLSFGGAGIDAQRGFASQSTGSVYYSVLLRVTDLTATTSTTGGYCLGLASSGTVFGGTLWLKKIDANTFNIGVNPRTTAANTAFGSTAYNVNETYLVVINYTFNASTGDDLVKLWVNPSSLTIEPGVTTEATNTGGTDLTAINRILIRQGSATDTPNVEIDELRVATNWADATSTTVALSTTSQNSISGLRVFPNPVTDGNLFITSDNNDTKQVSVFDVLGKQVIKTTVSNQVVNVSALNSGVYIVKITENGKTATRKLVIK